MSDPLRNKIINAALVAGALFILLAVIFMVIGWTLDGFNAINWQINDPPTAAELEFEKWCDRTISLADRCF